MLENTLPTRHISNLKTLSHYRHFLAVHELEWNITDESLRINGIDIYRPENHFLMCSISAV